MAGARGAGVTVLDPEFGAWVERQRKAKGMSLSQLAEASGLHSGTIRDFETMTAKKISIDSFQRLSQGLQVEFGYMLYKAGFDIGRDGMDMARIRRVEVLGEAWRELEHDMRRALAEAAQALSVKAGTDPMVTVEDPLTVVRRVSAALSTLDVVTERLRDEGFLVDAPPPVQPESAAGLWRPGEIEFMRNNLHLSNEEIGRRLGRPTDGVRYQRKRMLGGANGAPQTNDDRRVG